MTASNTAQSRGRMLLTVVVSLAVPACSQQQPNQTSQPQPDSTVQGESEPQPAALPNDAENQLQPGAIVEGDVGNALDMHLRKGEQGGFSGVALVAVRGEIVLSKGYGLADRERRSPYTQHTVNCIGSVTKQFTAAAILKLEEEGRLSTESTLGEFFPEVTDDKRNITLHQLLTHSSGLRSTVGGDYDKFTNEGFLHRVFSLPLVMRRGVAAFRYSNVGYSLLGFVVERVSGMSYEAFLADRFFNPLGMTQTGYVLPTWPNGGVAIGYKESGEPWGSPLEKPWAEDGPYWGLKANGGILSTVGDMYRWITALRNGEVLSEASMNKLWTGYVVDAPDVTPSPKYAYGWRIITTKYGNRLISHNGSNDIFFASVRVFPDDDVVLVLASNTVGQETWRYEQPGLWRILFESDVSPATVSRATN